MDYCRGNTKTVPLASLHADAHNTRYHDDRNLKAITASLTQFGQVEPLLVQSGTGRVVGGNGRLAAMRALGWSECTVVELPLDDKKATALGIALNRTAELASWDTGALEMALLDLGQDFQIDSLGFDTQELQDLLEKDFEVENLGAAPPAALPPAPPPASALAVDKPTSAQAADATPANKAGPAGAAATENHVRLVQLFYDGPQFEEFSRLTALAKERHQAAHLSEAVLLNLRHAATQPSAPT